MKLDFEIMEKIREFYSKELSEADTDKVEDLIRSDEQYALHNKLFLASRKGIKAVEEDPKKEWMRKLDRTEISETQQAALDALKKNDRSETRSRGLFLAVLVSFLVIIGYVGWQQFTIPDSPTQKEIKSKAKGPVAEKSIRPEEKPLGDAGNKIPKEVTVRRFSAESGQLELLQEKKTLIIQKAEEAELAYLFRGDTLILLTEDPKALNKANFQWVIKGNTSANIYLIMENQIYELDKSNKEPNPLLLSKDAEINSLFE